MNPMMTLMTALSSLGSNKLRASLTLLGIVIGVMAVITLMAVGKGSQQSVTDRITSLGTNLLYVRPDGTDAELTLEDAYSLIDPVFAPSVEAVAPELQTNGTLVAGRENMATQIIGVTSEYIDVLNFEVGTGQFISVADVANRSDVVVLGSTVAEELFGTRDPVGQTVKIDGRQFAVIGVLESVGGNGFGNRDNQVLAPITTVYYRLSSDRTAQGDVTVQTINVKVADVEAMDQAETEVESVLRLRHRISDEDDFTVTNQQDTIDTLEETTQTFVVFLGSIAGISLLVAGIGIMNIMLVSVTERTREIGIRKAIGAKRKDITFQFVLEATLLSVGGGAIGVIFGILLSTLIDGKTIGGQAFQTIFEGDIAVLALVVSAAIGLFFGIYPALRAASLHPIEALRYE